MVRPFVILFFLALMSLSVEAATSGTSQQVGDYPRVATVDWTLVETLMSLGVVPVAAAQIKDYQAWVAEPALPESVVDIGLRGQPNRELAASDRKSTRLNSSHVRISYAVFCLKKKKKPN